MRFSAGYIDKLYGWGYAIDKNLLYKMYRNMGDRNEKNIYFLPVRNHGDGIYAYHGFCCGGTNDDSGRV